MKSIPLAEPIIRFGGSPTSVATPPVSDSRAAARRNGIGVTFIDRAMSMINGPKMTTVVTLSSKSDRTVTADPSSTNSVNCRPFATLAAQAASASNPPVGIIMETMAIMQPSKNTTFQSTAVTAFRGS